MEIPRLADDGGGRDVAGEDRIERDIVVHAAIRPPRAAEGDELGVHEAAFRHLLEELHLFRIGRGVSALDVIQAKSVEPLGDGQFVLQREAHTFRLHAVA